MIYDYRRATARILLFRVRHVPVEIKPLYVYFCLCVKDLHGLSKGMMGS